MTVKGILSHAPLGSISKCNIVYEEYFEEIAAEERKRLGGTREQRGSRGEQWGSRYLDETVIVV